MNTINYDVLSGETLNVGRQYEHHKSKVVFSGYEPVNAANEIYLKWEGADSYLIPMVNFTFDVVQPLTKKSGIAICQIEERAANGSLVSESNTFSAVILESLEAADEIEVTDDRLQTIYSAYNTLYQQLITMRDNGSFDGADGEDGYSPAASVVKVGNKATITITDESGTTTAQVLDGTNGTTPQKYVDYFTDSDIDSIVTTFDNRGNYIKAHELEVVDNAPEYVTTTDYATNTKGGVFKVNNNYGIDMTSDGQLKGVTFANLDGKSGATVVSKGTLENVLNARDKKFELIETITLSESAILDRSAEPNGTEYRFNKIIISIDATPFEVASWFALYIYNQNNYGCSISALSTFTSARAYSFCVDCTSGMLIGYGVNGVSVSNSQPISTTPDGTGRIPCEYITRIKTSLALPSGSVIKIYGVRG